MNLGGMDIFDSPLPGEAHAQVKKAVRAGDSPQGNARCTRLTCREAGCNSVCEHRLWTSCVPGRFFAEPPAKPRSTQVFKTRGHGGGGCLCILKSSGGIHIVQRRKPGFWASHICPHPPTPLPAHTRPHLSTPHTHTCPHSHPPTPTPAHTSACTQSADRESLHYTWKRPLWTPGFYLLLTHVCPLDGSDGHAIRKGAEERLTALPPVETEGSGPSQELSVRADAPSAAPLELSPASEART